MRLPSSTSREFHALWVQEALGSTTKLARSVLALVGAGMMDIESAVQSGRCEGSATHMSMKVVRALANTQARALNTWEELRKAGVVVVAAWDDRYPQRLTAGLAEERPPVLFCKGNLGLLDKPGVGFCGSRRASPLGIAVAQDCARQVAASGYNVVSGNARGVDIAAHSAALAAMGTTTVVLSEGILRYKLKPEMFSQIDMERTLIVSQFHPKSVWCAGYAMTRNLTIIGLTDAMVVVEAGPTGGTFHAGVSSLRIGRPLFAADYAHNGDTNSGNAILIGRGAIPLRKDPTNGQANLGEILRLLRNRSLHYEYREPAQQALFPAYVSDRKSGGGHTPRE